MKRLLFFVIASLRSLLRSSTHKVLAVSLGSALHSAFVIAAEPPTTPILRIEAGMHTAPITRMAVDATGRLVLTVSQDKTARLWAMPDGRLLHVLRPPLGQDSEGKLHAGALTPDGTLAAVGGTAVNTGEGNSVYLFDTISGRMLRRLSGLPHAITDLAFSAQGRFLAAVLVGGNGLRVWETATGREVGRDIDYGGRESYAVDWHGDERLVTTCYDGQLRLYKVEQASPLVLLSKATVQGGKEPHGARFSPDGRQIAVGFADSTAVAVMNGSDLSFGFAPDTAGVDNGNLGSVTWSNDGATLAAGGTWAKDRSPVRLWPESGRGRPRDAQVALNSITDLRPLPGGRILFAAQDPAWGIVENPQPLGAPPIADYRDNRGGFRLSPDGNTIGFAYLDYGKNAATFSITERRLEMAGDDYSSLPPPLRAPRMTGLPITGWYASEVEKDIESALKQGVPQSAIIRGPSRNPNLAGKPLVLERNEPSWSLAIASDTSSFLLGAEWSLRSYTAAGQERWKVPVPGVACAVNLADNDQLAVAAYADGTIRWHRADNGQELLAFFPHADRKRWVLWATVHTEEMGRPNTGHSLEKKNGKNFFANVVPGGPADAAGIRAGDEFLGLSNPPKEFKPGTKLQMNIRRGTKTFTKELVLQAEKRLVPTSVYYDCSPGAEDLIGWHVNRSKDQAADFFPVTKFREQFYRPDVIQLVLQTRDVAAAVTQANARRSSATTAAQAPQIEEVIAKMAPPVVELTMGGPTRTLELPPNATEATLTYRVRAGSVPISQMRVLVDSRPVTASAPIPANDQAEEKVTVLLPAQDCVVALLAGNRHAFSEPALVNIRRKASAPANASATPQKGTLYLLAVGVSALKNQDKLTDLAKLEYADDDANAFFTVLSGQKKLYQKIESRVLIDAQATAGDILDCLDWLKGTTKPEDTTMVLLAGHGESDPSNGRYAFCAHDYDRDRRQRTGVGFEDIKLTLAATHGEVLLFLDACSAANVLGTGSRVDISGLVNRLVDTDSNIIVFASSDGRTPSLESDDLKQGLFTHCLKEGLSGKADLLHNGHITLSALQTYVDDAMRKLSNDQQIPVINIPKMVPNLTLGLVP